MMETRANVGCSRETESCNKFSGFFPSPREERVTRVCGSCEEFSSTHGKRQPLTPNPSPHGEGRVSPKPRENLVATTCRRSFLLDPDDECGEQDHSRTPAGGSTSVWRPKGCFYPSKVPFWTRSDAFSMAKRRKSVRFCFDFDEKPTSCEPENRRCHGAVGATTP